MAEIVKKAKAPAKPRKTAAKKTAEPSNVTEMPVAREVKPVETDGVVVAEVVLVAEATNVVEMRLSYDKVAELAHRYWIERGRQHGHHVEDWFRAEQELRGKAS